MKTLVLEAPHRLRVEERPRPALLPGDLLLRVDACGLCVSDIHKIRFRAVEKPLVLGHEVVGRIVETGPGPAAFRPGDRVSVAHHVPCGVCHYCRHDSVSMCPQFKATQLDPGGFAEFVRVPAAHAAAVAFLVAEHVSDGEASFMEPLACCWRGVRRLKLQPGDTAVIVGLGSIGLLMARLVSGIVGGRCIGLDLDARRVSFALETGLAAAFQSPDAAFRDALNQFTEGRGADAVIVTAGTPALVTQAIEWLRDGGVLNLFASFHPDSAPAFPLNPLYYREITIVPSYSPAPSDLRDALEFIASGRVRVSDLPQAVFALDQMPQALAAIENRQILKAVVRPHG